LFHSFGFGIIFIITSEKIDILVFGRRLFCLGCFGIDSWNMFSCGFVLVSWENSVLGFI
jgi:hypothetical protein